MFTYFYFYKQLLINILDLVYFTTWVPDTSYTSATQTTLVRHDCYANNTSATRVTNFDFGNDTSENIVSNPYISYIANEKLQGKEQFHFKN